MITSTKNFWGVSKTPGITASVELGNLKLATKFLPCVFILDDVSVTEMNDERIQVLLASGGIEKILVSVSL